MRALGGLWHQHSVGSFDKVDGAHISHDLCTGIDLGIELLLDLMDRLYASCQRCLLFASQLLVGYLQPHHDSSPSWAISLFISSNA
jgi:hypothetical protein